MNQKNQSIFLFLTLIIWASTVYAQESPPVLNFLPADYEAGNQNWEIMQGSNDNIYVANNEGLLEFNGAKWKLYPSPNKSIIRSLETFEDKIFIGSYMEFGFYARNSQGVLEYSSLSSSLDLMEDEIFWHIKQVDNIIIFQSLDRLYIYDVLKRDFVILSDPKQYVRIFSVDNQLYIQKKGWGIYRLDKGSEMPFIELPEPLRDDLIVNIFQKGDSLILVSRHNGLYVWSNEKLQRLLSDYDQKFSDRKIFSALLTSKNEIFLGTISEGIIHLDGNGNVLDVMTQGNGLTNNTILNLFEDVRGNVWLALDNGIDCLNNNSFIREYNNTQGILGTVYATLEYKGNLYLGSNQGLFVKPLDNSKPLKAVENTEGQVWSIFQKNGNLFCGHALGVFQVENGNAKLIASVPGVWGFREIVGIEDKILIGSYSGLSVLAKKNGDWALEKKISGFDISSRFFEITDEKTVWVNHESKGVYKVSLSDDLEVQKVIQFEDLPNSQGSALVKFGDKILYSSKKGVFEISPEGHFVKEPSLSKLIDEENYLSAKLIYDDVNKRLWSFNKQGITFARQSAVKKEFEIQSVAIPNDLRRSVISFENLFPIGTNKFILGKTNGYIYLDLAQNIKDHHLVNLYNVRVTGDSTVLADLTQKGIFPFSMRTLEFSFNVPYFEKYKSKEFSYILEGYDQNWSSWGNETTVKYEKLPFGTYSFKVKSKVGNTYSENIENFDFKISRPISLSNSALVAYSLLLFLLIVSIHKSYKKYYLKKHEEAKNRSFRELENFKIKNEQKITDLKNKQLEVEIESKNRELAILTMNNIKRNDFLRKIRKELISQTDLPEKSSIFKLIDSNLNNTKDWEFFEEAFNNADNEFLNRAKKICPELNHNDLKFCTYIRLNLSPKEIASLLNISTKSVEVRRYRLRKKLGLGPDINLTDYILEI